MELSGKVVLVAGGGGGIGSGIAKALAAEGCKLVLTDCSEELLVKASSEIQPGETVPWKTCDITDYAQVQALYKWVETEAGTVDILVNSAGMNIPKRMLADIDPADFERVMAVNTTGAFHCIHAALPAMRAKGEGLIINLVSLAGLRVMPLAGLPYCTSKYAAGALGTFTNLEEINNGIKVTNIYPGETNTSIIDKRPVVPPPEKRAQMIQPEDIAACVVTIAKLPARAIVPELVITPRHMLLG